MLSISLMNVLIASLFQMERSLTHENFVSVSDRAEMKWIFWGENTKTGEVIQKVWQEHRKRVSKGVNIQILI